MTYLKFTSQLHSRYSFEEFMGAELQSKHLNQTIHVFDNPEQKRKKETAEEIKHN